MVAVVVGGDVVYVYVVVPPSTLVLCVGRPYTSYCLLVDAPFGSVVVRGCKEGAHV
jgi:hypothetical protein